ncbi:MAG: sulfite exporter TauE/SafE family protein [Gemmatimonadales bacterium]
MISLLIAALIAGLLGSVHCIGMCGGFAASCSRVRLGLPAWHLGRVLTYGLLGALAGAAGHLLPGPAWVPGVLASLLLAWFALALAGLVPEPRLIPPGLRQAGTRAVQRPSVAAQFLFGVVNGFLPCGLVYSALTIPVAVKDPLWGGLAMLAFGLGTIPALSVAALGIHRLVLSTLWRRRLLAILILVTGLWTIWSRASSEMIPGAVRHDPMPGMSHQ